MKRQPHFYRQRGKRVVVWLTNGDIIHDRFQDSTDRHILLKEHGQIPKSRIRAFSIDRVIA